MQEHIEVRLEMLKRELEVGQAELQKVEMQRTYLRETGFAYRWGRADARRAAGGKDSPPRQAEDKVIVDSSPPVMLPSLYNPEQGRSSSPH